MRRLLLTGISALSVSSCDPHAGRRCAEAHEQSAADRWCVIPQRPIVIDGAEDDWDGAAETTVQSSCVTPPCDGLVPLTMKLATIAFSESLGPDYPVLIHVHVILGAPPPADPNVRIGFQMRATTEFPITTVTDTILLDGAGGLRYWRDGYEVNRGTYSPMYWAAHTASGVEIGIDPFWLLYGGAALLTPIVERFDGTEWRPVVAASAIPACWDPNPVAVHADPCLVQP